MSGEAAWPGGRSPSLLLAGAGKMGGALLYGWLDRGLDPHRITIVDPHMADDLAADLSARGVALNPLAMPDAPEVLVLAIKPQMLAAAAPALSALSGPATLVMSIVAGKTIGDLERAFPVVRAFARAMPNTPAAIRRGITGVAVNAAVTKDQTATLGLLLGAVGEVEWLPDETLIDAETAVSGSGPAYVFYLTECLAAAAEAAGLEPAMAMRLARATVEGASALMASSPAALPDTLRRNVTSPGGTTAAALDVLMDGDRLKGAMREAVAAAQRRAGELAG